MCGIAGIVGSLPRPEREVRVSRMLSALAARGPDGSGQLSSSSTTLGSRRLQIVGGAEGGHQPVRLPDGSYMVFNGELYDWRGVAAKLGVEPPEGCSDAWVLAQLLLRSGPEALAHVSGMFAAALFDARDGSLLLVRDAVGQKPLYVREWQGGWAFASTLSALRAGTAPMTLRREAVHEYLIYRSVGGLGTSWQGVVQLPPASWMRIRGAQVERGVWWKIPDPDEDAEPSRIRDTLFAAVARRVPSGHGSSVFLSGGLDSSLVTAALSRTRPETPVRCFIACYETESWHDESAHALRLAEELGCEAHPVMISAARVPELLHAAVTATEDPIQDPVTVPTLALSRAAAAFGKVVLTGDGSDEVWGGYQRFDAAFESLETYLPRTTIFAPGELGLDAPPPSYLDGVPLPAACLAPLDRALRLEMANRFRNYHLNRIDKLTMCVGLEARSPFLDREVLELGYRLTATRKRPRGRAKGLLIDALRDDLPAWLCARDKQPFSVPIEAWLGGALRDFAADLLDAPSARVRDFVGPGAAANSDPARRWSLLQLEVWFRSVAPQMEGSCSADAT